MKSEHMFLEYARNNQLSGDDLEYSSWHFGDNQADANELAGLVLSGQKTATSSIQEIYELMDERVPQVGDYSVIENWNGKAVCVIKTIAVNIIPFKEVTAEFAAKEGEGDRSLAHWRAVHIDFFRRELAAVKKQFSEDVLIVYEEFEVVR